MQIFITDATGKRFWNTQVAAGYASGERNNMARRFANIRTGHAAFAHIDAATARIVEQADHLDVEMTDDELLAELNA